MFISLWNKKRLKKILAVGKRKHEKCTKATLKLEHSHAMMIQQTHSDWTRDAGKRLHGIWERGKKPEGEQTEKSHEFPTLPAMKRIYFIHGFQYSPLVREPAWRMFLL